MDYLLGDFLFYHLIVIFIAGFIGGFVDAISGGGGFITSSSLLYIGFDPVYALGTGRLQSMFAESSALLRFAKEGKVSYRPLLSSLFITAFFSVLGTLALQYVDITKIVPFILLGFLAFYLSPKKKTLDTESTSVDYGKFYFLSPFIGFYNGFFGLGTGSIWSISIMTFLHIDIKRATMFTKPLNLIGNFASFLVFLKSGMVHVPAAIFMGISGMIGASLGAKFVIYQNPKLIKILFGAFIVVITIASFVKYY